MLLSQWESSLLNNNFVISSVFQLIISISFLAVTEEKWFRLSQGQRQKLIDKFNQCSVRVPTLSTPSPCCSKDGETLSSDITLGQCSLQKQQQVLSVSLENGVVNTRIPFYYCQRNVGQG